MKNGGDRLKIILIAGKARTGKDAAAKIIQENLLNDGKKVLIIHYADLLKYLCSTYFNWDGNKDEVGRTLLQRVGTDIVRTQQPDYWVDFVIGFLSLFKNEWDYVIIPDCRFPNELEKWDNSDWDNITVKINRTDFETPLTPEQQSHPSEVALDLYDNYNYIINSENGLDKLDKAVNEFILFLKKSKT